jgi:hypothetical protein
MEQKEQDYLLEELAGYLQNRYEKCSESVEFLCKGAPAFRATLLLMWERDFYRDKLLKCYEENG